ncbi:MAG: hypothetical protein AAF378_23620 [Cyanobacteria bacterium P01_A01_bin.84]
MIKSTFAIILIILKNTLFQKNIKNTNSTSETVIIFDSWGRPIAQKIINLKVGEATYNVEFVYGSFFEIFGNPLSLRDKPTFWENYLAAEMAIEAIKHLLSKRKVTGIESSEGISCIRQEFFVPYSLLGGIYTYSAIISYRDRSLTRFLWGYRWKSNYWETSELNEKVLIAKFYPVSCDRSSVSKARSYK